MATIEFTAFPRATEGRGASRRMRRSGKAPGIVYGGSTPPQPIELDHNALIHALRNEVFHASILTMKVDGASTQVLLRDVQMHPFRNEVLHVDFQRIDPSRKIHMKVPLHFVNEAQSPAVKSEGAIISHVMTELDIACLPKDLPEFIEIDLSELDTAHSLHVSGVKLPPGVSVVSHRTGDPVVATAVVPKAAAETEETAAEGEAPAAGAAPAAEAKPADAKADDKGAKKESGKDDKKK
ncbi:MAG TPA: 50S ribosomal protein L25/general stress protein Ctc [Casimicrobiaceae bacterium]|jgi:large subunit ribosomal protein L25|nr:50S ribosomal protein L25/general stress protein Ctc [Casimicrobiaceae bacterium]